MPTEVIMPKVDMDMASGKIMSWHVAEGATVAKGDPLFDIETDKAAMEVEAPADGILHHTAPEGMEIPIGTACAWLYAPDEDVGDQPRPFETVGGAPAPDGPASGSDTPTAPETAPETDPKTDPETDPAPLRPEARDHATGQAMAPATDPGSDPEAGNLRATPRARSLAANAGLDLAGITGTGPRGRVQAQDVQEALQTRSNARSGPAAPAVFRPETGALAVTRSRGGTGTPLVLIHGFASDATSWAPLESALRGRPFIRIDLPGHGKSPKLRIDSFADLVRELRGAFDRLDLEKAHLVGHSLGGAISLALADTRAPRVASLTLISPAGLGPDINGASLAGLCAATREASLAPWLRTLVANEDLITDSYARLAMAGRADPNLRAAQAALADVLFPDGVQAFDLRAALDRLQPPARIVWGRQDRIIPWQHALRAPGKIALHLFDGVGHMPQIEAAAELAALLDASL